MRRLWMVLILAVVPAFFAGPAQAGGWAVTVLDPLPARVQADTAYTVGYWVLQHGSHPFEGELGKSGLRLVGADRELEFVGRALPEPAHFAVSVAVPAGTWRVYAMQGWFAEFEIGTLTVPGGLTLAPSEQSAEVTGRPEGGGEPYWGAIHPPYATSTGSGSGSGSAGSAGSGSAGSGSAGSAAGAGADGVRPVANPAAVAAPEPAPEPGPRIGVALLLLTGCLAVGLVAPRLRGRLRG